MVSRSPSDAALQREVVSHYERQLGRFGPTPQGMDWKDEASQQLRFSVLCELCDLTGLQLHEVGSGAGHLLDWLRSRHIQADYSGSDLSAEMVAAARKRHPGVPFDRIDLLETEERRRYDVLLCSGLFHVKLAHSDAEWWAFVCRMLKRMWELCRVGIAFNLMSDHVDFRAPELFYADAGQTLGFCRSELTRRVVLRHDYPLYEYTVYAYRDEARDEARDRDDAGGEAAGE